MIKINDKKISKHSPTFIVAEIGANHNGSLELAKQSIDAAIECKVDAVKFQTYTKDELLCNPKDIVKYGKNGEISTTLGEMFDKVTLKREFHEELFNYAKQKNIICFSTPFSVDGVNFLEKLNNPLYKIASSDVNYVDLLKAIAKTKKPLIISSGKCTLSEFDKAMQTLYQNGTDKIVVMHCVANYPSLMKNMNLKAIKTLKKLYPKCIIGFSDHSLGIHASLGAVCFGAKVIEKHFTIDKNLPGPDHWFSMDKNDMSELVRQIRDLEMAFGDGVKTLPECEILDRKYAARSLVSDVDLKKGQIVLSQHLKALRPGYGISPFDLQKVVGLRINCDILKNQVLEWKHFK